MFDLIVIGAGPGGYVTAIRAAQLGMKVALVEKRDVGGTCLNRGCIPTKTLLHAGELFAQMNHLEKMGMSCENPAYSAEGIKKYRNDVVKKLRTGTEGLLKSNGVNLFRGHASFQDNHNIMVEAADGSKQIIEGQTIILAVGSIVNNPTIPGIEFAKTSDDILEGDFELPQDIVVAGASVIGVEFAEVFNAFGKNVTIIATRDRLLPKTDKELGLTLGSILKRKNINIRYHCRMKSIEKIDNKFKITFTTPEGSDSIVTDMVVSCIGRVPNLADLKPENAGIKIVDGGVKVNSSMRTSASNIYAIGDCIGGKDQLAHVASAQGITVIEKLLGKKKSVNLKVIPTCIYTSPEVANVGMTEEQCISKGIEVEVGKFLMSANGKSIIVGQDRGFIKTICDKNTGKILGAQLICDRATDIVAELGVAIANGRKKEAILKFMHPHPTIVEAVAESVEDAAGHAIHMVKKQTKI